ncbi:MAG: hypothetical protein ABW185_05750 [Sedimenticola sp.]
MFQHSKCRRQYKSNEGKRSAWFKKGHRGLKTSDNSPSNDEIATGVPTATDVPAVNDVPTGNRLRLTSDEVHEVAYASEGTSSGVLLARLRPTVDIAANEGDICETEYEENIIVSLKMLSELCKMFSNHSCNRPNTDVKITQRLGMCISVSAVCHNCRFKSQPVNLTSKIKTNKRGPPAGALNEALLLPVLKSKMGLDDVLLVMSCLNVKTPNERSLRRKINKTMDAAEEINKEQMLANQQYVAHINTIMGRDNTVDVQYDTSFASRPQAGCEASEQSFAPLIEHTTSKKLVLSIATANKLCNRRNCDHRSCGKNFRADASIASSERKLLHDNLLEIKRRGKLKVRSVTSDASSQIAKALRDYNSDHNQAIKHYKCFIHRLRSLQKKIKAMALRTCPKKYDKSVYLQKLSSCIRGRIRLELLRIRKTCSIDAQFAMKSKAAINNILPCFKGVHRNCRENSLVCTSHLSSYSPSFLPYGVHMEITGADIARIQQDLDTHFSNVNLHSICKLYTTNMCESLHSKVFTYAPKSTNYARNFTGLCHSATHSRSIGSGRATIALAKARGLQIKLHSPMYRHLMKQDKRSKYHANRKKTQQYKYNRYLSRKRKSSRKQLQDSLYSSEASCSQASTEHSYGHNCGRR